VKTAIKWPNDVQISGRKLSGILVESESSGTDVSFALIGIGINVNYRIDDPDIAGLATSLIHETGRETSREMLLATSLNWFEALYEGDAAATHAEWKARLSTLGQPVTVRHGDKAYEGTAEDVDAEGSLVVRLADGTLRTFEAGEVSLRA
jgi:BirA family biotin operon repressor/biotin-[acetyl-CoA-carboxylase] ligase